MTKPSIRLHFGMFRMLYGLLAPLQPNIGPLGHYLLIEVACRLHARILPCIRPSLAEPPASSDNATCPLAAISPHAKAIEAYYAELADFHAHYATYEQATRAAFEHLLRAFQSLPGWTLLLEQPLANGKRPDGTFRDTFNLPRGYWEAKDTADDLDAEIAKKLQAGYPTTNIIFEDTRRAVLYQDGRRVDQFDLTAPRALADLLTAFFGYAETPHENFYAAVAEFKERVPDLARGLLGRIQQEHAANNPAFSDAWASFYTVCRESLDPQMRSETVDEMLVQHLLTEPRPRNPSLADAMKRIGLTERTGRGVDLIYQGLLRYGRPAPDYSRSDPYTVIVLLSGGQADTGLLRIVLDEERRVQSVLPVDTLITLDLLHRQRRVATAQIAHAIQRDEAAARNVLERLVEAGLVEAHGIKKGRTYTLSSRVYRELGQSAEYVRQAGFDPIQQEQMIVQFVATHGQITRKEAASLCKIGPYQASRLLRRLVETDQLVLRGDRKAAIYERAHK